MEKAEQIYKKYTGNVRFIIITGFLIYLAISAFLVSGILFPITIALAVPMAVIIRKLTLIKFRKHILGVILDDLNAPLFREVIRTPNFGAKGAKNILWDIQSEFYVGNVRGAIELCEASLTAGAIRKRDLRTAFVFLAQFYCTLDDRDGLASACRRFRELGEPKLKTEQAKLLVKMIAKYEAYLAGDYEGFMRPTGAKRKGAIYPIVSAFEEAFIDMKKGELDSARAIFSALAVSAENTVFGMIAKRAVDAIDNGGSYGVAALIEFESIDCGEVIKDHVAVTQKARKTKWSFMVLLVLIVAFLMPGTVRSYLNGVDEVVTRAVFERVYGEAEILDIVSFKLNGEQTEKIVLADVGGELIVGGKYWSDEGEMILVSYARFSYSELAEKGKIIYAFNPRGTSEFVYIKIYDGFVAVFENDHLLCQCYFLTDNTITVIIDDEVIE